MSDRYTAMKKRQGELLEVARNIYYWADKRKVHSTMLISMLQELWTHPNRNKIPGYAWEFCHGYERCLNDLHWLKLTWVFPWQGEVYGSWGDLPESGKEFFRHPGRLGFHVYKEDRRKCFTGNQEAFYLLLGGDHDDIERAAQIMEQERKKEKQP